MSQKWDDKRPAAANDLEDFVMAEKDARVAGGWLKISFEAGPLDGGKHLEGARKVAGMAQTLAQGP